MRNFRSQMLCRLIDWLINVYFYVLLQASTFNNVFFSLTFLEIFSEINFQEDDIVCRLIDLVSIKSFLNYIYLYLEITLCMFLLLGTGLRSWFIGEPREFFLALGAGSDPLISEPTADPRLETGWTFNPESVPMVIKSEPEFKPGVKLHM